MKYDVVLFDADGTLLDFLKSEKEAVGEVMSDNGIEPTDENIKLYSEINAGLWKKLERREIEKKVLLYHRFELLLEALGKTGDAKGMAKAYMNSLSTKGYLLDGAEDMCRAINGKVRAYIVTNGVEFIQRGRYARCGIDKYFDDVFISDCIGCEKPAVEYFDHVSAHIGGIDKKRTLIVGDSLTSDMQGGINYGIDTCWYNPNKKACPDDMSLTYIVDNFDDITKIILGEV